MTNLSMFIIIMSYCKTSSFDQIEFDQTLNVKKAADKCIQLSRQTYYNKKKVNVLALWCIFYCLEKRPMVHYSKTLYTHSI